MFPSSFDILKTTCVKDEFIKKNRKKAEYKDLLNNLIAKTLQLKIYYELAEFDLLESHLQTLKIFISRKKALEPVLKPYDEKARMSLKVSIEKEEILSEKSWLLAQLV